MIHPPNQDESHLMPQENPPRLKFKPKRLKAEIAPGIEHRQHKRLNNRAEASDRHTRRREKIMGRFNSPGQAQRFLSAHDQIAT